MEKQESEIPEDDPRWLVVSRTYDNFRIRPGGGGGGGGGPGSGRIVAEDAKDPSNTT